MMTCTLSCMRTVCSYLFSITNYCQGPSTQAWCPFNRHLRLVSLRYRTRSALRILDSGDSERAQPSQRGSARSIQCFPIIRQRRLGRHGADGHWILQESRHRRFRPATDGHDENLASGRGHVLGLKRHADFVSSSPHCKFLRLTGSGRTLSKTEKLEEP